MEKVKSKNKTDALGDRIKENYENITRYKLMRRSYTIIRLDIVAAHTFTKGFDKPFDDFFIDSMNETAKFLCSKIMGIKCAYTQSDEITLIIVDFEKLESQSWFDNNLQKMCSVSAGMASAKFNEEFNKRNPNLNRLAFFDARVFQVPTRSEAMNTLLFRQNDAVRNSISMLAQSLYSHKELHGKNSDQLQELSFQKGYNWNNLEGGKKRGRLIKKVTYVDGENLDKTHTSRLLELNSSGYDKYIGLPESCIRKDLITNIISSGKYTVRSKWESVETPNRFTENEFEFLKSIIPNND